MHSHTYTYVQNHIRAYTHFLLQMFCVTAAPIVDRLVNFDNGNVWSMIGIYGGFLESMCGGLWGLLQAIMGGYWDFLGGSCKLLEASCGVLCASYGRLGEFVVAPWANVGRLGGKLVASWALLGILGRSSGAVITQQWIVHIS
jgi:hypothetical protein